MFILIPLFSDKFCKILLDEIDNMQKEFAFVPNPDEDEAKANTRDSS